MTIHRILCHRCHRNEATLSLLGRFLLCHPCATATFAEQLPLSLATNEDLITLATAHYRNTLHSQEN